MDRRYVITSPANIDLEEILRQIADISGYRPVDQLSPLH
jgi:hypothetical protein